MFGPVVTTEAHLAFSGARTQSNNTAEMTAMIEALSFLCPHGPVARDEQSCTYYDSQHAAGVCLGTIQARTHVQLALACQRSMICAQHKLRLTMQHVYGHSGNLGDECADHATALGTFGLTSNHNVATRWIHNNFDASVCFDGCKNIAKSWNDCNTLDPVQRRFSQMGVSVVFTIRFIVFIAHLTRTFYLSSVILLSAFFLHLGLLISRTGHGKLFLICLYRAEF